MGHKELLQLFPALTRTLISRANALFPVQVTRSFFQRATLVDINDPLLRQVLPHPSEVSSSEGDISDPVGDRLMSPIPWVVQKHNDRVLLLLTKRCHLYCRYCFRRDHDPGDGMDPTSEEMEAAIRFCEASSAREVILSGGDPLCLRTERLLYIIDRLQGAQKRVRIHTRAPITAPDQVRPELIEGLAQRRPIWLVVHANHAQELDGEVSVLLRELTGAGIPVLNQSVLLAGVNDEVETLATLCVRLTGLGVKPYYLHLTDPVPGNALFRVGPEAAIALHHELSMRVSGLELPRLVVDLPDGSGKMDVGLAMQKGLVG